MKLRCLGSGSSGKLLPLLENDRECLVLEDRAPSERNQNSFGGDFNISKIVGALVTHEHGDHFKGISKTISRPWHTYKSYWPEHMDRHLDMATVKDLMVAVWNMVSSLARFHCNARAQSCMCCDTIRRYMSDIKKLVLFYLPQIRNISGRIFSSFSLITS